MNVGWKGLKFIIIKLCYSPLSITCFFTSFMLEMTSRAEMKWNTNWFSQLIHSINLDGIQISNTLKAL